MSRTDTTATKKTNYRSLYFKVMVVLVGQVLAALVVLATVGLDPAKAAYPGANGKIAFASTRTTGEGVDNPTGDYEIFTMNPDGTGITQLTNNTA
jgi:hypothetical protein